MPVLQVTAVNLPSAHPTEGPSLFVSRWRLAWRFVFNVMNVYGNSGMPDKCTHLGMTHVPKLERPHTNNNPRWWWWWWFGGFTLIIIIIAIFATADHAPGQGKLIIRCTQWAVFKWRCLLVF